MSEPMKLCDDARVIAEAARCAIAAAEHLIEVLQKEENKEGKETFPPAPPIEKREQTKEAPPPTRVRAGVSDVFLKQWKITEAFFQYWLKRTEGKKPRNPERSVHNYWTHRKTDKAWFEFLRDYEATQAKAEEKHYNLLGEVR